MIRHDIQIRAGAVLALIAGTGCCISSASGQAAFSNVNPIIFNDSNAPNGDNEPASPYPSTIVVSGLQGEIAKITVRINALTHIRPTDVNLLLRSPEGTTVSLMGDTGGLASVSDVWLEFDDRATTTVPAALVDGTYRPTLSGDVETFPAPAPAGPHQFTLSSLIGEDPNGTWRLYVIDDEGPNPSATSEIEGSWAVVITTGRTFTSTDGPILIPATTQSGDADPYPSSLNVSGLPPVMDDCFVTLNGVNHSWISDMDLVLRAPNGRAVTLLSDAVGTTDFIDDTLVFEDESKVAPTNASGYYHPFDLGPDEDLPSPAPAAPYAVHLGRFSGIDPNGEWRLFCADDAPGADSGSIESWSITFLYPTSSFSSGGGSNCPGDADGDGDVDFSDLNLVLDNFAEICLP